MLIVLVVIAIVVSVLAAAAVRVVVVSVDAAVVVVRERRETAVIERCVTHCHQQRVLHVCGRDCRATTDYVHFAGGTRNAEIV